MEHTKTPWHMVGKWDDRVDGFTIRSESSVIGWAAYLGGTNGAKANAAFIVKAVNNHEQLLATLEKLACLGNGDFYGNSEGNIIAQKAIKQAEEE